MSSILTNTAAMTALQTLRGITRNLETVQEQLASGKKVATSRDNAAVWSVSAMMTSDVSALGAISETLTLGSATVGVARAVAERVVSTLQEIKTLIVLAQDPSADRAQYQSDIEEKTALIQTYVDSAQFNGLNLLDGSAGRSIEILAAISRDSAGTVETTFIPVETQNLSTLAGGGLAGLNSINLNAAPGSAANNIDGMLETAIDAAAAFGGFQERIEGQNEFVQVLIDAVRTGIGALTDADMEAAASRLQALQVQQQLGVQALAIANDAPKALLSLFKT